MSKAPPFGVFAGSGALPVLLCQALEKRGDSVFVFRVVGEADEALRSYPGVDFRWGEVGNFLRLVRENGIGSLTLAGGISKRPDFSSIRLDTGTIALLPRILGLLAGGDDTLIGRATALLEEKSGLKLVSALEIAPDLALENSYGPRAICGRLSDAVSEDLAIGTELLQTIGQFDIGQAAVVIERRVVAVEAAEGTDGMLRRVAELRELKRIQSKSGSGVIVKAPKPGQDMRFDIPVIGPETIRLAAAAGLAGVAVAAGSVLLLHRDDVLNIAQKERLGLISFPFETGAER